MIRRMAIIALLFASVGSGCGRTKSASTEPPTEEEAQKIQDEDARIDAEERGGSGTATKRK